MGNTINFIQSHLEVIVEKDEIAYENGYRIRLNLENPGDDIQDFYIKARIAVKNIKNSYILMPGAVYNGNRADEIHPGAYPPRLADFNRVGPDGPAITADFPRYEDSLILQTYDLSVPACGIYFDDENKGIILKTDAGPVETPYGFELGDDYIAVCFPCIRKKRYRHCAKYDVPPDKGILLRKGENLTFNFEIRHIRADDRPAFAYAMSGPFVPRYISAGYDYDGLAVKCIKKINNHDYDEEKGIYLDSGESGRFQIGWVSGLITAYTMLLEGSSQSYERAVSTIRFVLTEGISPCGLPLGIYDDKGWRGLSMEDGMDFAASHIRRIADGVYYMFKILSLGIIPSNIAAKMESAAEIACDRMIVILNEYGHFGHNIDLNTGKILWGGSAAGITCISALCAGYIRTGQTLWLDAAKKAGRYYRRFNEKGCWTGGPGDILMAPDSESNYAAMEAFHHLWKITGESVWKHEFINAAYLMTTWICLVDLEFPEDSTYSRLRVHTPGLVMANAQNKTLAPGICTTSGLLFETAAAITKDRRFSIIRQMILDAASQIATAFNGNIPEDVNASDSLADRGELYTGHGAWTENAYILSVWEVLDE